MKVNDLLAKMTPKEKIGQLNLINPGGQVLTGSVANEGIERKLLDGHVGMMFGTASIESRIEIQRLCVERTRLGIPMLFASDVIHGYRTALPLPLAMSCSWDLRLLAQAAHLSATEARADGIDLTFAPMVDVSRDPRWGRVAEGFGESSFLAALMTSAMVRGFQGENELVNAPEFYQDGFGDESRIEPDENEWSGVEHFDGKPTDVDRMLACVKHFAGYGAADGGREYASVQLGPAELHATHLPPFLAAVRAGVASLMPGFHSLDRTPVTAHRELLTTVLRKQWGFDGAIISDYTAISELVAHGLGTDADAAVAAFAAGVDMDMVSELFLTHLQWAIQNGAVKTQALDDACRRVLTLKQRCGLLDNPFKYLDRERASAVIGCDVHRQEARRMASACCVLLKNDDNLLPLRSGAAGQPDSKQVLRIALIGPLAEDRSNLAGTWSVSAVAEENVSLGDGLRELAEQLGRGIKIETTRGSNLVDDPIQSQRLNVFGVTATIDPRGADEMIDEAVSIAIKSDVVVLAVGEAKEHAGECSSRTELNLPAPQQRLVEAVAKTGRPIALIVMAGRPLVLTDVVDRVDAILYVWYGGSMAGPAIADVVMGKINPSAKLTMSMPRSVGQIPVHHDALPTGRPLPAGFEFEKFKSCYLDEPNSPLFPFGFGLSYCEIQYGEPTARLAGEKVEIVVWLQNLGDRSATEIVQCYASPPPGPTSAPTKMLVAFQRVILQAGETKTITMAVDRSSVALPMGDRISNIQMNHRSGQYRFGVGPHSEALTTIEIDW